MWLEGDGLDGLMREGDGGPSDAMLVSDAGAESPLDCPFISLIREEITSPPVGTEMLRVPTSWGSLYRWGQKTKAAKICCLRPAGHRKPRLGVRSMNSFLKWLHTSEITGRRL